MINWKIHPRAVAANVTYLNDEDKTVAFERVDRPTQKTVEDAVEQEGEKWTHTYSDYGVRKDCILIHDKPDIHGQVLVMNRYGEYVLTGTAELKPIKPTLTKAQAWDKICESEHEFDIVNRIKQMYDII